MAQSIRWGIVFPQNESDKDVSAIRQYAQQVEGQGFDYLLAYDHVLGANPDREGGWKGPYTDKDSFHEVLTFFSYLSAITERLEMATGILILPQRQTALVAKQAAQVDFLSNGRLRLGIGIGWNPVEYEALNESFKNRGKRSAEQAQLLRQLWTQELVTYEGQYHRVSDAGLNPMPVQRPIPIWFGGMADVVLERMAKLGDGWMPATVPIDQVRSYVAKLRDYLAQAGRKSEDFGIDIRVNLARLSPVEQVDYVAQWRELGATHVAVNTMGMGLTSLQAHYDAGAEALERLQAKL
jgi:probable F420-dependent oxidoreductase